MKETVVVCDVDDVIADCNGYALKTVGREADTEQLRGVWDGEAVANIRHLYLSREFVKGQPLLEGAKEFVAELRRRGCRVYFATAVPPEVASTRFEWLKDKLEVNADDVIIGRRKDLIKADVFIDDAPHNVLSSIAKWPILFRQPWNREITGMLSANSYDDILCIVDLILNEKAVNHVTPEIVCLVAPSGSGKTEIIKEMADTARVPIITTTATSTTGYYQTVSQEDFATLKSVGAFLEMTAYANERYGITAGSMETAIKSGAVIVPTDICGACTLKRIYGGKLVIVYVKKERKKLIENILNKPIPNGQKVLRIMALDSEERNAELCDYVVENNRPSEAAKAITEIITGGRK